VRRWLLASAAAGALVSGAGAGLGLAAQAPATTAGERSAGPAATVEPGGDPALAPLLRRVHERMEELDRRERELAERERSLDELASETTRVFDELDALRAAVEGRIAAFEALRGDGVAKLAKVYAAMPPARAAALLDRVDPEVATAVIARMKDKKSAAVLASMAPERALRVTRATVLPVAAPDDDSAAQPARGERGAAALDPARRVR
jgi:flagellar motility protein MotE (MotC chaperone)